MTTGRKSFFASFVVMGAIRTHQHFHVQPDRYRVFASCIAYSTSFFFVVVILFSSNVRANNDGPQEPVLHEHKQQDPLQRGSEALRNSGDMDVFDDVVIEDRFDTSAVSNTVKDRFSGDNRRTHVFGMPASRRAAAKNKNHLSPGLEKRIQSMSDEQISRLLSLIGMVRNISKARNSNRDQSIIQQRHWSRQTPPHTGGNRVQRMVKVAIAKKTQFKSQNQIQKRSNGESGRKYQQGRKYRRHIIRRPQEYRQAVESVRHDAFQPPPQEEEPVQQELDVQQEQPQQEQVEEQAPSHLEERPVDGHPMPYPYRLPPPPPPRQMPVHPGTALALQPGYQALMRSPVAHLPVAPAFAPQELAHLHQEEEEDPDMSPGMAHSYHHYTPQLSSRWSLLIPSIRLGLRLRRPVRKLKVPTSSLFFIPETDYKSFDPLPRRLGSKVVDRFYSSNIVQDLGLVYPPRSLLSVKFANGAVLCLGNHLSVLDTFNRPSLSWPPVKSRASIINHLDRSSFPGRKMHLYQPFYTIIMLDPDVPLMEGEYIHWLQVNVPSPGKKGSDAVSYINPLPYLPALGTIASPNHRYVFLIYAQTRALDVSQVQGYVNARKHTFKLRQFANKFGLEPQPVAGNYYYGRMYVKTKVIC